MRDSGGRERGAERAVGQGAHAAGGGRAFELQGQFALVHVGRSGCGGGGGGGWAGFRLALLTSLNPLISPRAASSAPTLAQPLPPARRGAKGVFFLEEGRWNSAGKELCLVERSIKTARIVAGDRSFMTARPLSPAPSRFVDHSSTSVSLPHPRQIRGLFLAALPPRTESGGQPPVRPAGETRQVHKHVLCRLIRETS